MSFRHFLNVSSKERNGRGGGGGGPVVECLTRDRGVADSRLTRGTAFCPSARHINSCLVPIQPRKSCPSITEKLMTGM